MRRSQVIDVKVSSTKVYPHERFQNEKIEQTNVRSYDAERIYITNTHGNTQHRRSARGRSAGFVRPSAVCVRPSVSGQFDCTAREPPC